MRQRHSAAVDGRSSSSCPPINTDRTRNSSTSATVTTRSPRTLAVLSVLALATVLSMAVLSNDPSKGASLIVVGNVDKRRAGTSSSNSKGAHHPRPTVGDGGGEGGEGDVLAHEVTSVSLRTPADAASAASAAMRPACETAVPADSRMLVITFVQPAHGSTALESLLMSSPRVSTLCRSNAWQCEGYMLAVTDVCHGRRPRGGAKERKRVQGGEGGGGGGRGGQDERHRRRLKRTRHCLGQGPNSHLGPEEPQIPEYYLDTNNYNLLDRLARHWNLSRPVLQDKQFPTSPGYGHLMDLALNATTATTDSGPPRIMSDAGIRTIRPAYVIMWTPLCVMELQGYNRNRMRRNLTAFVQRKVSILESMRDTHRSLIRSSWGDDDINVPVHVLSYADLVFRDVDTASRLTEFLPCAGPLRTDFVPRLGVDVFPKNQWKVRGSVHDFGRGLDPLTCCGYDVSASRCVNRTYYDAVPKELMDRIVALEDYFRSYSMHP